LRRAIAIREELLGRDHTEYATTLACLAGVLWSGGRLDEAESLYRTALEVREDVLGARHPEAVRTRKELARLLRRRGDWAGAQLLLDRLTPTANGATVLRIPAATSIERLGPLAREFANRADCLDAAAERMRNRGLPVADGLIDQLESSRADFDAICREARERAACIDGSAPRPESLRSLDDVAALLDDVAEREIGWAEAEETRRRALGVLDRVAGIAAINGEETVALRACRDRAQGLRRAIAEGHWSALPVQAEKLAAGDHVLVALLKLIDVLPTLSDRDWAAGHEWVSVAWGRALASAASCSRLTVRPAQQASASESASGDHQNRSNGDSANGVLKLATFEAVPSRPSRSGEPVRVDQQPMTVGASRSGLLRDAAVANLVPTMGRVINFPDDTTSSEGTRPLRLLRAGKVPAVVAPGNDERAMAPAP
jgi:hypothetical protein